MPGKRKACDMEPQDRLVGRNLNVPCEYFGAETAPKPPAKKAKKASHPFVALVLKPVAIANQFYTGAGVEVRLARTVHNRDIWWLPLPHAAEFVANNEACDVCGEGDGALDHGCGEMLMCDGCPCSFHIGCIGLGSVPAADEWFCDGECCGGPPLRRPAQQQQEEEEVQEEADSKAAARKPPKAKKQRKKTAAPPQSAVVDAAQEEERLFQQQLAQAVRKVQAEHGMSNCHFWSLVAKAVGTADAEQCAAAWFDRVGSPQQQEGQQRHKAKVAAAAAAAATKRRTQEEQQQKESAAEAAAGAEGQNAAASASSSMPPPLAPPCPRLVVPAPHNTPVAKLPGRGTVKHRALLRGLVEKQEAGHVDVVSMETPEQLFLSPSVDLDDESPICFGGFGGGFGGGAIGFSPAAAAAAPLADRTNAAAPSCGGAAGSSGGANTPARMSITEHDRYVVQCLKNRGKSRAERQMDALKAAGGARAVKAKSGGYVYTAGAPPKARASGTKKARVDGSHATQLRICGHVAKATMTASGHVVMSMPDLSEGDSDEERSSDEEEEEEEEGGFAGGFSVPVM